MENKDIEIMVASDPDHEECYIEIYYKRKFVGRLTQEDGLENVIIEFAGEHNSVKDMIAHSVHLSVFEEALEMAKGRLTGGGSILHHE